MPEANADTGIPTVEVQQSKEGFFNLLPGVENLPACAVQKRDPHRIAALLGAGSSVGYLAFILFVPEAREDAGLWLLLFLVLPALGSAIAALRAFTIRRRWVFRPDRVEFNQKWLVFRKAWSEPMTAYRGITMKRRKVGNDKKPLYTLTLTHATSKRRNVILNRARQVVGIRKAQGRYARLLGVPGFVETGAGEEERMPDDVDRSVRERVAAGTLADSFDPTAKPPGRRLTVAIEGETLVLRVRRGLGRSAVVFAATLFAIWAVLDAITFAPGVPAVVRMIEFMPLTAGVLAVAVLIMLTEELRLSPDRVTKGWRLPWGQKIRTAGVAAQKVTDVVVAPKGPGVWRSRTVQMVADADVLHFGGTLNLAAKAWVRDCIVAVISK